VRNEATGKCTKLATGTSSSERSGDLGRFAFPVLEDVQAIENYLVRAAARWTFIAPRRSGMWGTIGVLSSD
jgi:hypothetical protein